MRQNAFPTEKRARWKVKALGVWFSTIKGASIQLNFEEKTESLKYAVDNRQFRRLTLLGKITVIKSLLVSQLLYILTPLPSHDKFLEDVDRIFFNFLWDGKGDKIKRTEMINKYDKGGLKMLDVKSKFSLSKVDMDKKKYLNNENSGKWKLFFDYLTYHGGKCIFTGNLDMKDIKNLDIKHEFLLEILQIWAELNFQENPCSFQTSPIWNNSFIVRIDDTPV